MTSTDRGEDDTKNIRVRTKRGRYRELEPIGRGGMGEIVALQDDHLGRVVALKVLREIDDDSEEANRRFLREARIQGQLEHPTIVPVYDLWTEPVPRFTMKRIRGHTLLEILQAHTRGRPRSLVSQFTTHRLLTAFNSVCLALDFAHENGVIHRDVKPGNIMMGDFGEVYLLDWGVARVEGGEDTLRSPRPSGNNPDLTEPGDILGTLGYVAPEQLRGEGVDRRSDVYALGAILFEMLTRTKLIPGDHAERVAVTLAGVDVIGAAAGSGALVAPELLEIVRRATSLDAKHRFPTARALHDDLERYLEGERDLLRRQDASREQTRDAREIFGRANEIGDERARDEAMVRLGRALALDPNNRTAMETIVQILRTRPKSIPRDVDDMVDRRWHQTSRQVVPGLLSVHLYVLLFVPFLLWMGVRNVELFIIMIGLNVVTIGTEIWSRRAKNGARATDMVFLSSTVWSGSLATLFGPFVLVPAVAAINTIAYLLVRRSQPAWPTALVASTAFVVPSVLQFAGVLGPSYVFDADTIVAIPAMVEFAPLQTGMFLLVANVAVVALPTLIISRFRRALLSAERQLQFQAWQLSRLLPDAPHGSAKENAEFRSSSVSGG